MASEKNLNAVFTDIANAIREKKGTTDQIKPINMAEEIVNLPSGGGDKDRLKAFIDERGLNYLFFQYKGTEITSLRFEDTIGKTETKSMFQSSSLLTNIPLIDTSSVTNMSSMFQDCRSLINVPLLDTSKVENMYYMLGGCKNITSIPLLDTSKVTNMNYAFKDCSSLTTIPQFDMSNVEQMYYTFQNCSKLTTIPRINVSKVIAFERTFNGCTSLKSVLMYGMKSSFDISSSTQFEESDLVIILNNLATVTSNKTLTMGSTNLAKLTDAEKAIATNKGWTLK